MEELAFKQRVQCLADELGASPRTSLLSEERYNAIIQHLQHPQEWVDPYLKHWVKKREFQLVDLPQLGLSQVLVVPNDNKNKDDSDSLYLRVLHSGNVVNIIHNIHSKELKHSGYKRVLQCAQRQYFGIFRRLVQEYCNNCPTCKLKQPEVTKPPPRLIVEDGFLVRVQVDLIDMCHCPDGDYKYIAHFMDHFSKFHILFPLKQKSALEVAQMIEERVLAYLGPPKIFHSNNGREFVNQFVRALSNSWGGNVTFVNGRQLHSQSQGRVKRGNRVVEQKLAAMKANSDNTSDHYPWASWLPRIMFAMNRQRYNTIGDSPYTVVFGMNPPSGIFPGAAACVDEEALEHHPASKPKPVSDQPTSTTSTQPPRPLVTGAGIEIPASPKIPEYYKESKMDRDDDGRASPTAPWIHSEEQQDLHMKEEPEDLQIKQEGEQLHGLTDNQEEEEDDKCSRFSLFHVVVKSEDEVEEEEEENAESSQTPSEPPTSSLAVPLKTVEDCDGASNTESKRHLPLNTDRKDADSSETDDDDEWQEPLSESCAETKISGRVHSGEKPLVCDFYDKGFTKPGDLKRRTRVHTVKRPFSCDVCGKSFQHQWNLKTHTRVHTGERPFDCDHCEKSFMHRIDLKRHMTVHTGEKPFVCDLCGFKFIRQGDLKRHIQIHTGEKPFSCDVCGTRFRHQGNLRTHMRIHTGEKPFNCAFCGKSFIRQTGLRRHMRVHTRTKASVGGVKQPAAVSTNKSINTEEVDLQRNPNP